MTIISAREHPENIEEIIRYISSKWPSVPVEIYRDCIIHTRNTDSPLPQWYILEKDGEWIGCAGLVTNDFISRMDLYPWLCALFIDEEHRGNFHSRLLVEKAQYDARKAGFLNIYLCTDHVGLNEKLGFEYIGEGNHPWGEHSRIYSAATN